MQQRKRSESSSSHEIGSLSVPALRLLQAYNEHSPTQKLDYFAQGITEAAATLQAQVATLSTESTTVAAPPPPPPSLKETEPAVTQTGVGVPFSVLNIGSRKIGLVTIPDDEASKSDRKGSVNSFTWTTPPRVLLVEDDAICRKLSSKLLQIFGCQFDVATDGTVAVNKMNLVKYDMVLMVRRVSLRV